MKIKLYQISFGCGCTRFSFKTKREIYAFCKYFAKNPPMQILAFDGSVLYPHVLPIVSYKNKLGWKIGKDLCIQL